MPILWVNTNNGAIEVKNCNGDGRDEVVGRVSTWATIPGGHAGDSGDFWRGDAFSHRGGAMQWDAALARVDNQKLFSSSLADVGDCGFNVQRAAVTGLLTARHPSGEPFLPCSNCAAVSRGTSAPSP